jgi:hypothetical protein
MFSRVDFWVEDQPWVGGFSLCSTPQQAKDSGTIELVVKNSTWPAASFVHNHVSHSISSRMNHPQITGSYVLQKSIGMTGSNCSNCGAWCHLGKMCLDHGLIFRLKRLPLQRLAFWASTIYIYLFYCDFKTKQNTSKFPWWFSLMDYGWVNGEPFLRQICPLPNHLLRFPFSLNLNFGV